MQPAASAPQAELDHSQQQLLAPIAADLALLHAMRQAAMRPDLAR